MAKITIIAIFIFVYCMQDITKGEDTAEQTDLIYNATEMNITTMNNSSLDDKGPEKTLFDLENRMKELMGAVFNQAFSYVSKVGIPRDTSTMCLLGLARMYFGIKKLEPWAFQMMDSSGKLSGGLLEGTSSALGDYDECLDVIVGGRAHSRASKGEYCLLEIKPPAPIITALKEYQINKGKGNISLATSKSFLGFLRKVRTNPDHVMFRMGLCMPSTCDEYDVQDIVDMVATRLDVDVNVARCEFKQDLEIGKYQLLIIVILCSIIALTVIGTVIQTVYAESGCHDNENFSVKLGSIFNVQRLEKCRKFLDILSKFSICSNTRKLLDITENGDALDVVRGVKVLSVIFAIYAHTYALPHPLHLYRFRNTLNFSKFVDEVLFGTVANSSVGVDTFFFLAGFLFIYYRWRLLKKPPVVKYIIKFILVNYLRMVAAQILVVLLFALFPLFGSGPLWYEFVEEPLQNCANTWWMNILFIQNFLGPYDSCLYHTWILATMMQLFIIAAIVVWLMHRFPIIGISTNIFLIVLAAIAIATVTVVLDFPATFTIYFYDFRTSIKYWKYLYVQTYNHLGPFCIGMLVAYFITENPPPKSRKSVVLCLWVVSVTTCCAIVFGLYHYREDQDMDRVLAVFYASFHRPAWAMAIGWIIYACATDNGGFINSILSWKALIPAERLCYLAFLLHIPLMYYHGGVQRERMFMGHYNQIMCFISYSVASFIISAFCYVLFQAPYETIEKYIFGIHKETIWNEDSRIDSAETLKSEDTERNQSGEENSKVLYSRYIQNGGI